MKTTILALAFAAAALANTPAVAQEQVDQWADAHPKGDVEIANLIAGSVEVIGSDEDRVHVTGRVGRDVERLELRTEGKHTLVKLVIPSGNHQDVSSDLRVTVPRGSRLNVGTVSADIEVQGVEGGLQLQSVSGDVEAEVLGEDAQIKSVSGDIEVRGSGAASLLTVTTVSGDATVTDVGGEIVVQTVSGDLEARAPTVQRARINTTNGEARLETALEKGARVNMETINGDLTLVLHGEVDAEFDLETFNGSIRSEFGPGAERTNKYGPGKELRFTQGEGSSRVVMETLNGGIIIRSD